MYEKRSGKIVCTIEARMSSTRLPGKVLLDLAGKPVLARIVDRVRMSAYIDEVVIATTTNHRDDAIRELAREIGCSCYSGSEDDVLSRVLDAAKEQEANLIVEVLGDCPLVDHRHIDELIRFFYTDSYGYVSNALVETFPLGFDVQVFPLELLEEVDRRTTDPVDRTHVTYYIYSHPDIYKLGNLEATGEMFWPKLRLTLDEKADYELIRKVYERLLPQNEDFSALEVVRFLRNNPKLASLNVLVRQKSPEEK